MRGDETSFFYAVLVKGGSSQYALAAIFILESTNYSKYSSDRDTLRVECKSAVFHADFLLLRLSRFGNSTGSDASS